MFPNYHRNLIKPKINRIPIIMNILVVFFSLNFNYFLFAPTFAEDNLVTETTVENTFSEVDALVEKTTDEPVEEWVEESGDETIEEIAEETTGGTTEEWIEQVTEEITEEWQWIDDVLSGSSDFVDEVPIIPEIWPNLDEILTWSLDSPLSGNLQEIVEDIIEKQSKNLTWTINSWGNEVAIQIDQAYFDSAFERDVYNHKVFDLQNILISLGFFTGSLNGIYDDITILSVYQYQLSKGIMNPGDDISLRWFFGPTTREYFNQEYVTYKQNLLNGISNLFVGGGISQNIITEKDKYSELLKKVKDYFMQNKYSLENIFGTGVFVWNEDIDFSMLSGQIILPLIFQSTNTLWGNIAEVEFEPGTLLKDGSGNLFTGSLSSPEFLDKSVADELAGQNIVSVLDVWWNDEKIVLENLDWEEVFSKIRIPVPWQSEWNILSINYSHDWETRIYMESQVVFLDEWEPYIEFETNHFTVFSISLPVGSFFINNNDFSTSTIWVKLNVNVSWATHMRFANTWTSLTSASWVNYATWYDWNLLSANGTKTVYAQFSGIYWSQTLYDEILLDTTATGSNLKFSLNGTMNGTNILDVSSNVNNFSGMWGITNPILTWEQVFWFNWSSQYAQRTWVWITYPFTISAWINTSKIGTTQSIVHMWNSGSTTIYYWIEITTTWYPAIVARNTTSYVGTSQEKLYTWRWYHVVWVFASATSRILYLDWNQTASNTSSVLFSGNTNAQIRVWRYVGSSTSYFTWYMDDVRLYNKTLSVYEIRNLYDARIKNYKPIQYLNVGEFTINSGESNTYKTWVRLISNVTWMTHMRFANNTWDLFSASWVAYNGTYLRYLSGSTGNNIVYAQYSGVGGIRDAQDNIFLDSISNSNLKVLLNWDMNGTVVLDSTANANNFTWISSITGITLSWERVLSLNGTTQYAERTGINITAYPFTMSAWVQAKTISSTDTIISMWNSATNTTYYWIQLVNWAPSIVASNTTAVITTSNRIIATWQRYHIVWVFNSGTNRKLYINWEFYVDSATTSATYIATNSRIRIWRHAGSSTTNYFDGYIDDASIYNKALSAAEIKTLYNNRTSRVAWPKAIICYSTTGATSWPVVATLTGFTENGTLVSQNGIQVVNNNWSWIYVFTWNGNFTFIFKDLDWNIWSTIASVNRITPPIWSLSLSGPASFSFGSTMVSSSLQSREKTFTWANDYFDMIDGVWADAWYYTTLAFSDLQYNSNVVSKNNIYVKTIWWITLRAGTANSSVVTAITWLYLATSSPLTFIKRDAGTNGWKTWTYGAQVGIKVDIPAFQQPWNYTWTIIYTLY